MKLLLIHAMVLAVFSFAGCKSAVAPGFVAPSFDKMRPEAALSDVKLARETLERLHPGYRRYTSSEQLDAMWVELEAKSVDGISDEELYVSLSRILAAIRCDHTKAELSTALKADRDASRVYLPFQFALIQGQMVVIRPGSQTALKRGDQITSIDGIPVSEWITLVEDVVPVDGENDHTKPGVIAYGTEFMGGALDHFVPFLTELQDEVSLSVSRGNRSVKLTEQRVDYDAYQEIVGERQFGQNFSDAVRFERIGDDGAYLAVDTFINYRQPVDPVGKLGPFFELMQQEGRTKLIVDLRANGGGSDDAQTTLLRFLLTEPLVTYEPALIRTLTIPDGIRANLSTWNESALSPPPEMFVARADDFYAFKGSDETTQPLPGAFEGELVVLIGTGNSSGSTHLLSQLRKAGRAVFIGERTGGSPTGATAGTIAFLTLPESGIRIRVPLIRTRVSDPRGSLPKRHGLDPDIAVAQRVEDIIAGTDPVLARAKTELDLPS